MITVAAGFPTTVAPIVQYGCVPVFVDVSLETANAIPERVADAVGPKTRAIMLAHALGNPYDLDAIVDIVERHDLYLVEDNCDALGSEYRGRSTGTFGHLATQSFYPPHHLTMGEGGAVLTGSGRLRRIAESFRDWGRDCWCPSGQDNTCGKRFGWRLGSLPEGYDHKYVYSHLGYNLKPLDVQAAIGREQLKKLDDFVAARRANHARLSSDDPTLQATQQAGQGRVYLRPTQAPKHRDTARQTQAHTYIHSSVRRTGVHATASDAFARAVGVKSRARARATVRLSRSRWRPSAVTTSRACRNSA